MKLASLSFKAIPRLPGVRPGDLVTIECDKPTEALKGWSVSVRGQQVFLVSPPGWVRDQSVKNRDMKGPVTIFEIPRAEVIFMWSCMPDEVEASLKGGKYDSEPFGPPPAPLIPIDAEKSILAQIPPNEIGD